MFLLFIMAVARAGISSPAFCPLSLISFSPHAAALRWRDVCAVCALS